MGLQSGMVPSKQQIKTQLGTGWGQQFSPWGQHNMLKLKVGDSGDAGDAQNTIYINIFQHVLVTPHAYSFFTVPSVPTVPNIYNI